MAIIAVSRQFFAGMAAMPARLTVDPAAQHRLQCPHGRAALRRRHPAAVADPRHRHVRGAKVRRPDGRILRRNDGRDVTADAPLRAEIGEYEHHCDWLAGGRQILLGDPDRHFNHCCDPTAYVREIDGVRYIYARRDIEPGDEITNDYAMYGSGDEVWDCNCGASDCRRTVHADYFHLPLAKQAAYLRYQPAWFLEERREEFDALRLRLCDLGMPVPPPIAGPGRRSS